MNGGGIFLIQHDETLVEMKEQPYQSEELLQKLLAKYPNLLAGDQINPETPRKWLFVGRELGVPSEEDGSDRWALDHLFLDQEAVPTLIEVKRSSDTRIRREVVGQMLDYAANAVEYWPVGDIRSRYEQNCQKRGLHPTKNIETSLGIIEANIGDFWLRVDKNLGDGQIRMVFVADKIPAELERIVEFLNGQMDRAEVLAVEIRQYVGQGLQTLVPRVIGQTVEAERKKRGSRPGKQWDEASFFEDLRQRSGEKAVEAAKAILAWAKKSVPSIYWGTGGTDGSFIPWFDHKDRQHFVTTIWTYGKAEISFKDMLPRKPFDDGGKRLELLNRLNKIPGVAIPPDGITRRHPSLSRASRTTRP